MDKRYGVAGAVALALCPFGLLPAQALAEPASPEIQQLQLELQQIKQRYVENVRKLREFEARIQAMQAREASAQDQTIPRQTQPRPATPTTQPPGARRPEPAPATTQQPQTQIQAPSQDDPERLAAADDDKTVRQARPSRSVEDLLQEEHAVFDRKLSLDLGVTYTRYDRKQLVLDGFLALDAIFLGQLSVEGVETDMLRYDLGARYGLGDRMVFNVNAPFIQRMTAYQKGGVGGVQANITEADASSTGLGDVSAGISYQLFKETPSRPDVVWNLSVTAPTGDHPYGVPLREVFSDDYMKLQVPSRLPTGNGIWSASTGLSFVRTADPAIVFGNIGYTYNFPHDFSDLNPDPLIATPGEVDLGNSINFGLGLAFALNPSLTTFPPKTPLFLL